MGASAKKVDEFRFEPPRGFADLQFADEPAANQPGVVQACPDLSDLVGTTIGGRYRVDGLIGKGGMGAVFRAHHLNLRRDVAVKVLHPELTKHDEIRARFEREARSSSKLEHPNCVRVIDYGATEQGLRFIAMQLLQGVELWELMACPMSPAQGVDYMLQIMRGLAHAHQRGVIHRDIKPENIFVTRDHYGQEVLKLVDFGIAKVVDEGFTDGYKTEIGRVFGTPAYMSPEQAAGREADGRTDLYAAGVIFYQLLAQRLPFEAEDAAEMIRMHTRKTPPPLPADVPPVLAAIVERLLAKQPEHRFRNADEVVEVLEGARGMLEAAVDPSCLTLDEPSTAAVPVPRLDIQPSVSRPTVVTSSSPRPAKARRHRMKGWQVFTASAAATISLLAVAVWGMSDSEPQPAIAQVESTVESSQPAAVVVSAATKVTAPRAEQLVALDRLLLANRLEDAEKVLAPLRDQFPKDALLLWRQGRLLSAKKGRRAQALAAYGAALRADKKVLEDPDFYAELHKQLRHRAVRSEALDLALHDMGASGHSFLLELVNDSRRPLPYHERRRVRDALVPNPRNAALIDEQLQRALDLLQAYQSIAPCEAYGDALDAIALSPDPYFLTRVAKATVPEPKIGDYAESATACAGLVERRDELLMALRQAKEEHTAAEPSARTTPRPSGNP